MRIKLLLLFRWVPFVLAVLSFVAVPQFSNAEPNENEGKERVAFQSLIGVFRGNEQIATATPDIMQALESVELNLPGVKKSQAGPRLVDLLAALKIAEFTKLTAHGFAKGRVATAEYSIAKDKIHERILLGYSRRGTVKLVVPELAFDDWLVDVFKLEIE